MHNNCRLDSKGGINYYSQAKIIWFHACEELSESTLHNFDDFRKQLLCTLKSKFSIYWNKQKKTAAFNLQQYKRGLKIGNHDFGASERF